MADPTRQCLQILDRAEDVDRDVDRGLPRRRRVHHLQRQHVGAAGARAIHRLHEVGAVGADVRDRLHVEELPLVRGGANCKSDGHHGGVYGWVIELRRGGVATCKAHGLDPWAYLRDVLDPAQDRAL